ncbi:hypothetical protein CHLRE_16g671250v5 [Chlamydomonas reinhardtii]|uniref:Sodium/hydrogen exchanger n=1 Tax=Chlamydomonas reinhardtii TaxID=3055 RepID=A0A2K3CUH4_CHLRE|nr:uncharacterized protein CHLRE_16g671250v5 [Chlamydomonas reinhardtii]PNW71931.1 hypothetical protein CHLRE_16g671250v5 [Chlamydomonas reinhardtii]
MAQLEAPPPEAAPPESGGKDLSLSEVLLIELSILIVSFVAGRALERIRFKWMGEAGAALLLGLVVGLIMKAGGVEHTVAHAVEFRGDIFFYVLLPTIMFDAGYGLDAKVFLRNVGSVCSYAFLGTTISTFVVGLIMWGFGRQGWCYQMTLLENLTFGALISATDPVTVLAVFQRLGAQPDLYINVFGESVLNDAVGLVLFQVITKFLEGKAVTGPNVMAGIGLFIGIFAASVAIGLAVGFLASLIFRSRFFYSGAVHDPVTGKELAPAGNSVFEVGVAVTFAYGAYLVADVAHCSGIVAVVTNGMVMNLYVRPNLSHEAEVKIEYLFKVLAALFELFVFCYIGTTLFLGPQHYNVWSYAALCLIALAASRAANIYPLSLLVNCLRPIERRITQKEQFMMWWSGLRGAMAFALAVEAADSYGDAGEVMKTVTFYIIFITVLWNGGSASYLLEVLRLRATDPLPNKYGRALAAKHEADVAASRAVADLQRASAALERKARQQAQQAEERRGGGIGGGGAEIGSGIGEWEEQTGGCGGGSGNGYGRSGSGSGSGDGPAAPPAAIVAAAAPAGPESSAPAAPAMVAAAPPPAAVEVELADGPPTRARWAVPGGDGGGGGGSFSGGGGGGSSMRRTGSVLQRLRTMNNGHRIVGGFERMHTKLAKLLVHPHAHSQHGAASPSAHTPAGPPTAAAAMAVGAGRATVSLAGGAGSSTAPEAAVAPAPAPAPAAVQTPSPAAAQQPALLPAVPEHRSPSQEN